MGAERRRHERFNCSIPCELQGDGKPTVGTVRNVSAAGLSVVADVEVAQGDVLQLVLQPPGKQAISIEAIVWHDSPVRVRSSGKQTHRLGLVLSDAPDRYRELFEHRAGKGAAASRPAPPEPDSKRPAERSASSSKPGPTATSKPRSPRRDAPGLPKPERFRARVKQERSPRTRSILVFAQTEPEARESALKEVGPGWQLLEVERV